MYYLTIGTYDGVHRGHLEIIKTLLKNASKLKVKSALIYFPIPPRFFLSGNIYGNLLTTPKERLEILRNEGIENISAIEFDKKISDMSADDFLKKILIEKYNVTGIVVGRDFALGHMREGNVHFLEKKSFEMGIEFKVVDFIRYEEHKISSSLIRNFLHKGDIEKANYCLSRAYFINGRVVRGAGLGKQIGFPTANLEIDPLKLTPHGVFSVEVLYNKKYYKGIANIGHRPTLNTLKSKLITEVHIFDFDKDIYGENIEIFFNAKIMDEMKFSSVKELVSKIKEDISYCRKLKNPPFTTAYGS